MRYIVDRRQTRSLREYIRYEEQRSAEKMACQYLGMKDSDPECSVRAEGHLNKR